ncbi:DinB family protein [Sphingobacterium sp. N143]|uniref:DinB family protein n=1 Tax=Sphingobacterium sp. N143 TaxID=2746727 RepID=UPI0025784068|nr:DinB family protein [Sphingobacterium sp. N143]MDM1293652.1 DinB family protein [Sphingobacterium sp. N143]
MQETFKFILQARQKFIELIDSLSIEQLNKIPAGFNNNIIWNFGHIVVSTQTLVYVRTGIKADTAWVKYNEDYKKDTKPTRFVEQAEVDELKEIAIRSIEQIAVDYENGVFGAITSFSTSTYGYPLNTIEEVIALTSGHDNVHFGYAMAQRRCL